MKTVNLKNGKQFPPKNERKSHKQSQPLLTLVTDLPLQPPFFEVDVLALYIRGAPTPTPPFGLPPCLQLCDLFPRKGTQFY